MDILKQRIGNTVLFKAAGLAEQLKIDQLYFKMEGLNPTGHMHDRIAYYLVQEAIQLDFKTVVVASLGQLGQSMAFMASSFGLQCRVVMPSGSVDRKNQWFQEANVEIIEAGHTYNEAFQRSVELARENNWYDANHGYSNCCITDTVFAEIAEEITAKLGKNPENVFCFLSNGALITGLHLGFRSLWRRGLIQRIPRIFVACAGNDNPLYQAFAAGKRRLTDATSFSRYKGMTKNNIEYQIIDPQSVLNAVYDSGGALINATNEEIKDMMNTVKAAENLKIAFRGSAAVVACSKALSDNIISRDQTGVVILEEGRNDLKLRQVSADEYEDLDALAEYVERYLGRYGDDHESVLETLLQAFASGFVIGAYMSGKLRGLAIVIKMPVEKVMPGYHLVYIGADITTGSRGIGTRLMEEVRRYTNNSFSLHVDVENKKAIRLYEKMGLKKAYYRMIAQ